MSAVDAITPTTPATTTAEAGGASSVASPPPLSPSDITDAPIVASTNSTDATPLVKEVDGKQYVTCKFVFSYYEHIKYTAQFPLDTPLRSVIKKLHEDWPYGDEVTKVDETAIQLLFQGKRIVSNKNTQMLNVLLQGKCGHQSMGLSLLLLQA